MQDQISKYSNTDIGQELYANLKCRINEKRNINLAPLSLFLESTIFCKMLKKHFEINKDISEFIIFAENIYNRLFFKTTLI